MYENSDPGVLSAELESALGLYLRLLSLCVDLSHTARPRHLHMHWALREAEERAEMGGKEKEMGLPVSPFAGSGYV